MMQNKYQKALKRIRNDYLNNHNPDCDILEELVDKATPLKPQEAYVVDGTYYICPCCGHIIEDFSNMQDKDLKKYVIEIDKYCKTCGQKLDWSDYYA